MKIISKETNHLLKTEHYDLNAAYLCDKGSIGLIICYLLCKSSKLELIFLNLEANKREDSASSDHCGEYSKALFQSAFPTLESFLEKYDNDDFGLWTIKANYNNVEITFSGTANKSELGLSYLINKDVNALLLLNEIENDSYRFNEFDKNIFDMICEKFKLSVKRATLSLKKLSEHKDIFDEFVAVVLEEQKLSHYICEQGYTAGMLHDGFPLSELGAYNYLIYLRESPQYALEDLKNGLPRK